MQQEERGSTCQLRWFSGRLKRLDDGRGVADRKRHRHVEAGPHVMELGGRRRCRHRITEAWLLAGTVTGWMMGSVHVVVTGLDVGRQLADVTKNQNHDEQREEPEGNWDASTEAPH